MAFNSLNYVSPRAIFNSVSINTAPGLGFYSNTSDTIATITTSAYFNNVLVGAPTNPSEAQPLLIGDLLYIIGSDGEELVSVTALSPNVTVGTLSGTIANGSITLAKLAPGITPADIIKFAGKTSNGGGSATITITATGTLSTDIAFAQVQASTNAVSVEKVTPSTDTITVLLSGDPGAATVIAWQVLRAAS